MASKIETTFVATRFLLLATLILLLSASCKKDYIKEGAATMERLLPGQWSVTVNAIPDNCSTFDEEMPMKSIGILTVPSFSFHETTLGCEVCTPLFLDLDIEGDKFGLSVEYMLVNIQGHFLALRESTYPEEPNNPKSYEFFHHSTLFGRNYYLNFVTDNTVELTRNDLAYIVLERI